MKNLKSITVLFVEDEENIRKALNNAIKDEFKNFILARDGKDGLKKFQKYKPDIVITDILMPIMDGLEMSKEIKKMSKETPIIVLSAFDEKERLLKAIDVGINKYLIKPIDTEELMDTLHYVGEDLLALNDLINLGNGFAFDRNGRVLIKDEKIIALTKKELLFITVLVKNIGSYVLHEELKKYVWTNKNVSDAAVRTFIKRVREKTSKNFIKNIPGLGYKINI
ncbi:MAG: response regulator transcription factor [Epsilonproteobacteria bacterium]|nr:response regulator transcription factor [Campylobacterota bacterium]